MNDFVFTFRPVFRFKNGLQFFGQNVPSPRLNDFIQRHFENAVYLINLSRRIFFQEQFPQKTRLKQQSLIFLTPPDIQPCRSQNGQIQIYFMNICSESCTRAHDFICNDLFGLYDPVGDFRNVFIFRDGQRKPFSGRIRHQPVQPSRQNFGGIDSRCFKQFSCPVDSGFLFYGKIGFSR